MEDRGRESSAKEKFWSEHIASWQHSGLSQGEYCRRRGLSRSSWGYWRARLARTDGRGNASPVTIVPVPSIGYPCFPQAASLRLLVGRFRIEIGDGFSPGALEDLVQVLERLA